VAWEQEELEPWAQWVEQEIFLQHPHKVQLQLVPEVALPLEQLLNLEVLEQELEPVDYSVQVPQLVAVQLLLMTPTIFLSI